MFFVLFSSAKINNEDGSPTHELETYRWPCEKHGNSRPQTSNDWSCDLLIVVAKANRTGNWIRLNRNGRSVGIMGIRGIRTPSSLNFALDDRRLNHAVHQLHNGKSRTVAQFRMIQIPQHDYDRSHIQHFVEFLRWWLCSANLWNMGTSPLICWCTFLLRLIIKGHSD